jgi:cytochrome b involved in lipid metabolism
MATVQAPTTMSLPTTIPKQDSKELDFMTLTMAALRLVNPWTVETKTHSWSESIESNVPDAKERIITLAEVSLHDTPRDCWVVIYDRVYDITTFLEEVS